MRLKRRGDHAESEGQDRKMFHRIPPIAARS
jgi:hypothetical protein